MQPLSRFRKIIIQILGLFLFLPFAIYAQWSPGIRLSLNSMNAALNENAGPCLAVSGDTVHVVWSDHRTNGYAIYYDRSVDKGITWSVAVPITDTTGKATMPAIAVSGSGIHVVWMDTLLGIRASYYKRSLDGGNTWGPNVCLDNGTKFWPGIAASGSRLYATLNKEVISGNTEVYLVRSIDNGTTWLPEQQISNADGRSEDPAIAVRGADVHLSWNDNRSGTMEIYYIHSQDNGLTWGPETPLTSTNSYSSMVSLNGQNVDVPYGNTEAGNFDIYLRQSADNGSNFGPAMQLTNSSNAEAYPYLVRDGLKLHMVYLEFMSPNAGYYLHSDDGGVTWDPAFFIGTGLQPFIAYSGCVLHVIWADSGAIHYRRNPTGNCGNPDGIANSPDPALTSHSLSVYPNPASHSFTVSLEQQNFDLEIKDAKGTTIFQTKDIVGKTEINCAKFPEGIYFLRAFDIRENVFNRKLIILR